MKWYKKLGKFFAVILSVVYSILLIIMIVLSFSSSFVTGDIYSSMIQGIDLNTIKVSDIDPRLISYFGTDATLEDIFVESLASAGIDRQVAKEFANNNEVKEVVGDFLSDCINYSINKKELPKIKESDVEVILDNIELENGSIKEIDKEEIMNYVDDINDSTKDYFIKGESYANRIN